MHKKVTSARQSLGCHFIGIWIGVTTVVTFHYYFLKITSQKWNCKVKELHIFNTPDIMSMKPPEKLYPSMLESAGFRSAYS